MYCQPAEPARRQAQRHDDTELVRALQYRHQLRIEYAECNQDNQDAVHEKCTTHIRLDRLLEAGLQRVPVVQREFLAGWQQTPHPEL